MTAAGAGPRFVRDRLTLSLDGAFVTWGWFLYGFTPAVPLLATEQGISRAAAGLHGTAMAVGAVLAGSMTSALAARLGRRVVMLAGLATIVVGIAGLMVGTALPATLTAVVVISLGGNVVLSAAQPALLLHHGRAAAAAVTEGNALGSTIGLLAPLAVGSAVAAGWGWRPAVAVTAVVAVVVGVAILRLPGTGALGRGTTSRKQLAPAADRPGLAATLPSAARPAADDVPGHGLRGFPRSFWFYWAALLCAVAIEFSTTFWAADLVVTRTGAGPGVATATVSALVAGMSIARFVAGPMSVRRSPAALLLVSYAVAVGGFLVVWTATNPVVAVVGLVVAGFGYGLHYPMAVSLVLAAAGRRTDQAQALATAGVGVALGIAPFALGALSDVVGSTRAFGLVLVLLLAGATAVALGSRSARAERTGQAPLVI